ncbi:Ada metal-binding domain-containing protein [Candidatus Methanocrinis natronophilus]|uniref:Ada metal-binding domain-containing protein n=1 Tax=Candidatus Methanocrinis natronophilus TaxID=3033396 RepID=A0ABT5X8T3_9EURY|nr:Ada metal-binding domain-containing protein [Candidatus Methanocrinis natronophilus]MDF0591108.1 Ada metal-binding domain-containing protein [Candidatus Methanocrinis natronophilus]
MSLNLLSRRRILLLATFLMALASSIAYLHMGGDLHLPSEAEDAFTSILEEGGSWISGMGSSVSRGGSSLRDLLSPPSGSGGFGPSLERGLGEEGGMDEERRINDDGSGQVNDEIPLPPSFSAILEFNSSVSSSLFRTWGSLTLLGGSTLQYLILNATLWDGDRLVENTRYMMMDLEPGKSRDFDIREICTLSPERGYSSLLEVEMPEGLFSPERRDCIVAEDRPDVVVPGSDRYSSRYFYSREEPAEVRSIAPSRLYESADDAVASSRSDPAYRGTPLNRDASFSGDTPFDWDTSAYRGTVSDRGVEDSQEDPIYRYVGSKNSDKYHLLDCTSANKIKPENRVYFRDLSEAQKAGYSPCKACNP